MNGGSWFSYKFLSRQPLEASDQSVHMQTTHCSVPACHAAGAGILQPWGHSPLHHPQPGRATEIVQIYWPNKYVDSFTKGFFLACDNRKRKCRHAH